MTFIDPSVQYSWDFICLFFVLFRTSHLIIVLWVTCDNIFCFALCFSFFQFVCVESLVTAVVDMYPDTFRRGYRRELLILGMSITSFLIGLIMCTEVRGQLHQPWSQCLNPFHHKEGKNWHFYSRRVRSTRKYLLV